MLVDAKTNQPTNHIILPGAVAWIVSHCDTESDREKYVEELKKHIQVGTFYIYLVNQIGV